MVAPPPQLVRGANLRHASRLDPSRNTGMRRNNTSRFKGVSFIARLSKFRAYIVENRKQINLGLFARVEDASAAYEEAAERLFGEFHRKGRIQRTHAKVTHMKKATPFGNGLSH
ncbi:hypothetical protein KU43P_19880 [Pseudomonas sp. KU43P]|nr:hypothetical protein KU43P_19880 [Pseudomonas sp. KU43P]